MDTALERLAGRDMGADLEARLGEGMGAGHNKPRQTQRLGGV